MKTLLKAPLLVPLLPAVLLCSGCVAQFITASYDVKEKREEDLLKTNYRVNSVKVQRGVADAKEIIRVLRQKESGQNSSQVPLSYDVEIRARTEAYESPLWSQILSLITLYVWPSSMKEMGGTRTLYDVQTDVFGDCLVVNGRETRAPMEGFILLAGVGPVFVLRAGLDGYLDGKLGECPYFDFREGSLESRLADAAFNSLTVSRYNTAIAKMRLEAKDRLIWGEHLSKQDERLLQDIGNSLLVYRAKHPDNFEKSREALQKINDVDDLVDIALHASLSRIREEAAGRVSGLSEERFAALAKEARDSFVERAFLSNISDINLLCDIVSDSSAQTTLRTSALDKIEDESVLANIAKSSTDSPSLRKSAAKRIQTESFLADVAKNAALSEVRLVAIGRIGNAKTLQKIVLKDSSEENRLAALAKIDDPAILAKIVQESHDVQIRLEVAGRINNQKVLNALAMNDEDESVRLSVLPRVKDKKILENIAEHDSSERVRADAIKRIKNPAVLGRIARTDPDPKIRLSVLSGVKDSTIIQSIVENDPDRQVRAAALVMVTDSEVLDRIARNNSEESIRLSALARVDDEEVITSAAKRDSSPNVRIAAIQKLENEEVLSLIAQEDLDSDVRLAAISKVDNAELLAKISTNDSSSVVRRVAVEKITDTAVLVAVVKNDSSPIVRRAALSKIDDVEVIADVALKDVDAEIRRLAVGRASDQSILRDVAKNDRDTSVKIAAIQKLTDESKQLLVEAIRNRAGRHDGLLLSGFYLGMDESDARLLFDVLLPNSSLDYCATFSAGKATRFRFSARELQELIGNGRSLSVEMIPRYLERSLDCSFDYEPETVSAQGVTIATMKIYRFSAISGETLTFYASNWEENKENIGRLVRLAQYDAPYDDPGFYVMGVKAGLMEGIERAKKEKPGMPPGTLIWEM